MIACFASGEVMPSNSPELTSVSSSEWETNGSSGSRAPSPCGRDDLADRQVECLREVEVALVVRGHGHDRAGAVVHEDVVGDEHGDLLAVHRVGDGAPERHAGLLAVLGGAVLG